MQVTLKEYCKTLSNYYNDWEKRYKYSIEQLNYQLKSMNENLYCGVIDYSYKKKALCFPISAIYASLFSSYWGSDNSYLYINKSQETGELILNDVGQWSINFPDYNAIFHNCYDQLKIVYNLYEEINSISSKMENMIHLDNKLWLLTKMTHDGFSFQLSIDPYGLSKRIDFSKKNNWEPIFKGLSHDAVLSLQSNLRDGFEEYMITIDNIKNLFEKPPEPKKRGFLAWLLNK